VFGKALVYIRRASAVRGGKIFLADREGRGRGREALASRGLGRGWRKKLGLPQPRKPALGGPDGRGGRGGSIDGEQLLPGFCGRGTCRRTMPPELLGPCRAQQRPPDCPQIRLGKGRLDVTIGNNPAENLRAAFRGGLPPRCPQSSARPGLPGARLFFRRKSRPNLGGRCRCRHLYQPGRAARHSVFNFVFGTAPVYPFWGGGHAEKARALTGQ